MSMFHRCCTTYLLSGSYNLPPIPFNFLIKLGFWGTGSRSFLLNHLNPQDECVIPYLDLGLIMKNMNSFLYINRYKCFKILTEKCDHEITSKKLIGFSTITFLICKLSGSSKNHVKRTLKSLGPVILTILKPQEIFVIKGLGIDGLHNF